MLEKRAFVTRLALARVREILTFPLPRADDVSVAAQEEQGLQLRAAQSALPNVSGPDDGPIQNVTITVTESKSFKNQFRSSTGSTSRHFFQRHP